MKLQNKLLFIGAFTLSIFQATHALAVQEEDTSVDPSVLTRQFMLERFNATQPDPQQLQNVISDSATNCTLAFRDHGLHVTGPFDLKTTELGLLEIKGKVLFSGGGVDFSAILGAEKDRFLSHDANIRYYYSVRTTGSLFGYLGCRIQNDATNNECLEDSVKNEEIKNGRIEARLDASGSAIWLNINSGEVAGYCPIMNRSNLTAANSENNSSTIQQRGAAKLPLASDASTSYDNTEDSTGAK